MSCPSVHPSIRDLASARFLFPPLLSCPSVHTASRALASARFVHSSPPPTRLSLTNLAKVAPSAPPCQTALFPNPCSSADLEEGVGLRSWRRSPPGGRFLDDREPRIAGRRSPGGWTKADRQVARVQCWPRRSGRRHPPCTFGGVPRIPARVRARRETWPSLHTSPRDVASVLVVISIPSPRRSSLTNLARAAPSASPRQIAGL